MKKVEAIFRHTRFDEVKSALDAIGVRGMTVTEVKGAGKQRGYTETYRGSKVTIMLRPKLQIMLVVDEEHVRQVVRAIIENATTGEIGDGKIFVSPIEEAIAIRTGKKNEDAV